jgi:hypothetical protein
MIVTTLLLCAVLLSFERLTYFFVSHHPVAWQDLCSRPPLSMFDGPVDALQKLFYGFKVLQLSVFWYWCVSFSQTVPPVPSAPIAGLFLGGFLIAFGQTLNFSVFSRLGTVGVFYGAQLGHTVPWIEGFPFSVFRHPQYLGTLMSIWGFFIVMRYPNPDWIILPLLQTAYYAWGAYHEP